MRNRSDSPVNGELRLGEWQVDLFESGRLSLDGGAMFGSVPRVLWERKIPADNVHRIPLAMRLVLLRQGDARVLVDTGVGDKFDERFADMFDIRNPEAPEGQTPLELLLSQHGVAPGEITHVVITHLHFDHAGGGTKRLPSGEIVPTFANAEYCIQRDNWETALHPNVRERASYLAENVEPLQKARLQLIDGEAEILPGLTVRPSNGHTAGMQTIRVEGGGEVLYYLADLAPTQHHLRLPFTMGYDLSAETIMAEKQSLFDQALGEDAIMAFEHDPHLAAGKMGTEKGKLKIIDPLV